jgi:MarR family 2-MHQ and catechol resistance regulon transcriptional repressor
VIRRGDFMDNSDLKLVIALAKTYNLLFKKLSDQVFEFDLSLTEFGVLEMLYHKGKQPVQKIAEKILVTSGTVTYVIDQLVKKEYVIRKKCLEDKRITYVELSELGKELIKQVFPAHVEYLSYLFNSIEATRKVELIQNLKDMQKSICDLTGSDGND